MTISGDRTKDLLKHAIFGGDIGEMTGEEQDHLRVVQSQVDAIRAAGKQPDHPHEWGAPSADDVAAAKERYGY